MDQEIVDYILQAQKHGLGDLEIKQNLLNVGWEANAVEQSFVFAKAADTHTSAGSIPPQAQSQHHITQTAGTSLPVSRLQSSSYMTAEISDRQFQSPATGIRGPGIFKKPLFWIVFTALILLAGGAYGYYSLVLANPVKIWRKFSQGAKSPVYQTKFNFSYSDPGEFSADSGIAFQLKNIKLEFNGSGYINSQNPENPESNSKIQYTFGSGNTSFSTGFEYMLQNKILYLNIGNNPILNLISAGLNNGGKIDWIKIDLEKLKDQASSSPSQAKFYEQLTNPKFKNELEKIWNNTTIIKEDKYIGREKINGTTTLHFKNSLDKQALKALTNQYVAAIAKVLKGSENEIKDSDAVTANQIAAQLIDKIKVKEFDTWVGMTDFKLYRVHLVANAPSLISLAKNASSISAPKSNDARRLADVRQMASAVELYYNDNNGYPDGASGKPVGLTPNYISTIPVAPPADGSCSFYNTYWYQPMGKKTVVNGKTFYDSYQMTFCLGGDTGGYKAGIAKLTPSGIAANIPCPGSKQHCAAPTNANQNPNEAIKQQIKDFISKLDFSAEIKTDADYTDYGKIVNLTPPANAFDLVEKLKQQVPGIQETK